MTVDTFRHLILDFSVQGSGQCANSGRSNFRDTMDIPHSLLTTAELNGEMAATGKIQATVGDVTRGEGLAWKIHGALQNAIVKVDTKASIVLTLETAIIGGALAAFDYPEVGHVIAWFRWLHYAGLWILLISAVLAGAAVFPQLRRREIGGGIYEQVAYFGQLRNFQPATLADLLVQGTPDSVLLALSAQLVTISRIAWIKHKLVQWSLLVAFMGCIVEAASFVSAV